MNDLIDFIKAKIKEANRVIEIQKQSGTSSILEESYRKGFLEILGWISEKECDCCHGGTCFLDCNCKTCNRMPACPYCKDFK